MQYSKPVPRRRRYLVEDKKEVAFVDGVLLKIILAIAYFSFLLFVTPHIHEWFQAQMKLKSASLYGG